MRIKIAYLTLALLVLLVPACSDNVASLWGTAPVKSPDRTVGLLQPDASAGAGYTLFAPNFSTTTYLIDMEGQLVHTWQSEHWPGQSAYLLENGNLLRTAHLSDVGKGPSGGGIQEIAWDGTVVWDFQYMSDTYLPHHDIEPLPNGNVLILAWEFKTREQAIAAGRDPALLDEGTLWPEFVVEVQHTGPTSGQVVWEWHLWDHLIQDRDPGQANYGNVAEHPELVDVNFAAGGKADWIHANAIDYNPELDQILITCHNLHEIWVVDHSTTTQEAAGHAGGRSGMGGDLLYRWGNPRAYGRGTADDQRLFAPHDAQWIESGLPEEGHILVFNNGNGRPDGAYSSVDEIVPPANASGGYDCVAGSAYGPEGPTWTYTAAVPTDFYADKISGAQRLANGNSLICSGPQGTFFEVTPEGETVWRYVSPVTNDGPQPQGSAIPRGTNVRTNAVFRAYRYAPDYAGLASKDLSAGITIEETSGESGGVDERLWDLGY